MNMSRGPETVLVPAAYLAVLGAAAWLFRQLGFPPETERLAKAVVILLTALILWILFRQTIREREKGKGMRRFLFCLLVPGLPFLADAGRTLLKATAIVSDLRGILMAFLAGTAPGICEEVVFRGIVFNKLKSTLSGRRNAGLAAALISSGVFAACHLANWGNQPVAVTVMQVYSAFGAGLCLCGLYLLSGTLALPVLLHSIVDVCCELSAGGSAVSVGATDFLLPTVILAEGLVLLRFYRNRAEGNRTP
ncbi:MAG: CPBP family intramembrane metalloprotease [Clostridia bacterium]|nr:CPBP family intramembrane metalloprotease [Clostridia bacterium]